MSNSFGALYQLWRVAEPQRAEILARQLQTDYRRAWEIGGDNDRYCVVHFVFLQRISDGFDLVVEALDSPDEPLASNAAIMIAILIREGHDLGDSLVSRLNRFAENFPHWSFARDDALALLETS